MKFTEGLFKIPVKLYDRFSIVKNILEEEKNLETLERPLPDDWVRGYKCIPASDIIGYGDWFSPDRKTGEVAEEGFDSTIVHTKSFGDLECTWKLERFEDELNKFVEGYEKGIEAVVSDLFKEKEARNEKEKRKNRWLGW